MEYFSFSRLKLYEECPMKYYYQYVLKIKGPKSLAMAFGGAIHSALEVFYREDNPDKAEKVFIEELTSADVRLKNKESIEKEGKVGLNMLHHYFNGPDRPYLNVDRKKVEYKFNVNLDCPLGGKKIDIPVSGIMDLITTDGFIVDHKVTTSIWREEDIDSDMQATVYWMAYEKLFGKEPKGFIYNFLVKRVKKPLFDAQPTIRDMGQKMYLVEYAQAIIQKIRKGEFPKKIGKHCRYCPYRFMCE